MQFAKSQDSVRVAKYFEKRNASTYVHMALYLNIVLDSRNRWNYADYEQRNALDELNDQNKQKSCQFFCNLGYISVISYYCLVL